VKTEADRLGLKTKLRTFPNGRRTGGVPFSRGHIYRILGSPIYVGEIAYNQQTYPGLHEAVIDRQTWDAVQTMLRENVKGQRLQKSAGSGNLLAGLLFDSQGNRFTPHHAMKGGQRYRYYVDRALVAGDRPVTTKVRRIPSHEIETVVSDGLMDLLVAPDRLMDALGDHLTAAEAGHAIRRARSLHRDIRSVSSSCVDRLRPVLHQVVLEDGAVRIRIARSNLREMIGVPSSKERSEVDAIYDLIVPTRVHMRGSRLKLMIENSGLPAKREPDRVLVRTVARAHYWLGLLISGKISSVHEIAKLAGVTASYVSRVLRLACLAPNIIDDILDARHPMEIHARRLILREDLPMSWVEQNTQLGFSSN
jgi:hypothetical protein